MSSFTLSKEIDCLKKNDIDQIYIFENKGGPELELLKHALTN